MGLLLRRVIGGCSASSPAGPSTARCARSPPPRSCQPRLPLRGGARPEGALLRTAQRHLRGARGAQLSDLLRDRSAPRSSTPNAVPPRRGHPARACARGVPHRRPAKEQGSRQPPPGWRCPAAPPRAGHGRQGHQHLPRCSPPWWTARGRGDGGRGRTGARCAPCCGGHPYQQSGRPTAARTRCCRVLHRRDRWGARGRRGGNLPRVESGRRGPVGQAGGGVRAGHWGATPSARGGPTRWRTA